MMIYQQLFNHLIVALFGVATAMGQEFKSVERNGAQVWWRHADGLIELQMSAPTKGWVAVAFNETDELKNAYLIMGAVTNGRLMVDEHYVFAPGDYRSFESIGFPVHLSDILGEESRSGTTIRFKLPADMMTRYTKLLSEGANFYLTMAFSREDDFRHHSMMRTSIKIKL
ncbi:MAG: DOMON domain-containing protein [Cyclobacteriaceae bacterium]